MEPNDNVFEAKPGELWITTMQGILRVRLYEKDFI
jgi:sialidase-1